MAKVEPKCENCKYFKHEEESHKLICVRYPPTHDYSGRRTVFPETKKENWCGEYKKK